MEGEGERIKFYFFRRKIIARKHSQIRVVSIISPKKYVAVCRVVCIRSTLVQNIIFYVRTTSELHFVRSDSHLLYFDSSNT